VCAFSNGATAHLLLGYPEQAQVLIQNSLVLAREINHVPSLLNALRAEGDVRYFLQDIAGVERVSTAILAEPEEHVTAVARANARMLRGWAWAAMGRIDNGVNELQEGLEAWRATGSSFNAVCRLGRAADALIMSGRLEQASVLLDEALARVEMDEERWTAPELLRLTCLLQLATGDPSSSAEDAVHKAVMMAQQAKAKWHELRAATSLARLWRDHGRRQDARDLLAPIYGWFNEGFDTPDLKEAKALLNEFYG
jgi:predicted ATPase